MHLGSNKNPVTLYFPFRFKSQEKYGITSSTTSKLGIAKGAEGKRKQLRETRVQFMLVLCNSLLTCPLMLQCGAYKGVQQPDYVAPATILSICGSSYIVTACFRVYGCTLMGQLLQSICITDSKSVLWS